MKKIILLSLLFLWLILSHSHQTFACSCMMPGAPESELQKAQNVFIGTVENISIVKSQKQYPLSKAFEVLEKEVQFKNITNIKWSFSHTWTIITANQSATCWVNFEKNQEYIVYAYENNSVLSTNICSRTNQLENAWEDIKEFWDIINAHTQKNQSQNAYLFIILLLVWFLSIWLVWIYLLSKKDSK